MITERIVHCLRAYRSPFFILYARICVALTHANIRSMLCFRRQNESNIPDIYEAEEERKTGIMQYSFQFVKTC